MSMKNKLLRFAFLLSLVAFAFTLSGCRPKVKKEDEAKHGLIIRNHLTPKQWEKINEVLNGQTQTGDASPRPKLFRIKRYSAGMAQENFGELDDSWLIEDFPTQDSKFEGYAVQVGLGIREDFARYPENSGTNASPNPTPSATPITGHAHHLQNIIESQKMVDAVDKILNPSPSPAP